MLKSLIFFACVSLFVSCWSTLNQEISVGPEVSEIKKDISNTDDFEQVFISTGLETNTSISSIPLDGVLWGWPSKDGIPAINNPKFLDIDSAKKSMDYLNDDEMWLVIDIDWTQRFYPYAILVWHEIVNDNIGDDYFSVTFCPLCGSGIVFNRELETGIVNFWVSGKLYQSNLLMYDSDTETLWSQSLWEAVVGERTWAKLEVLKTNLVSFKQFQDIYPDGLVLSDDTGHNRNYWFVPYGWYDASDTLYFPVDNDDTRLHKKEILYVVNHDGYSVAFLRKALVAAVEASLTIGDRHYVASYDSWKIDVNYNGKSLDGFHEMRFSRANKHPASSSLRTGE